MARQYEPERIFFCHPKRNVTGKNLEDFQMLSPAEKLTYRVVSGHFSLGLYEKIDVPSV